MEGYEAAEESREQLTWQFERMFVLASIWSESFRQYAVAHVREEFLNDWACQKIYGVVVRLYNRGRPVTFVAVHEFIRLDSSIADARLEVINDILSPHIPVPDKEFLESALASVIARTEDAVLYSLTARAIADSTSDLREGKIGDIFARFRQIESEALFQSVDEMDLFNEHGHAEVPSRTPGIPTGIKGLTAGGTALGTFDSHSYYYGIGRGQIMIIGAEAKLGKTTFILNMALYQVLLGYNVHFYSMEMDPSYLKARSYSILTGIPTMELEKRSEEVHERLRKVRDRYPDKGTLKWLHYEDGGLTCGMIDQKILRSKRRGRAPDIVYVDYVDIMGSETRGREDPRITISRNTRGLRAIGKRHDCAMITPSQVHRKALGKEAVTGENIAGDISKIFTGDLVIFLSRRIDKEKNKRTGAVREKEIIKMNFERNRYGDAGLLLDLEPRRDTGWMFDVFPEAA